MQKAKAIRLAGFVGALGASAVLVGAAVQGTGAYFSDSHDGTITGSSGHLTVSTSSTTLDYSGLIPDEDQSKTITYTPDGGSPNEDVWMTFDATSQAYGKFTGTNHVNYGGYTEGGLGGYGHFKIVSNQGFSFESYNMQVAASGGCYIDANGDGGSSARATGPDNGSQAAPECGVPGAILIGHNISAGVQGSAVVTFGLTGKATGQNIPWANVPFKIVATQVGIRPDAANF
jgi:hypothetical protein